MPSLRQELFPQLGFQAYLNHAAMSPLNSRAMAAMNQLMASCAAKGVQAWPEGLASRERLRENLGRLIHAQPSQIGLISNTSQGILAVAHEYPWQVGDRMILVRNEFPGNIVSWLDAAKRYQLQVIWLDPEDLIDGGPQLQAALAQKPRLLAVSWVQYQTGRTQSLQRLTRLRREHGLHICLDAIQGLGPLTMNLEETPLDFVVCGGHKWLLSPEGTGFLYTHPDRLGEMKPLLVGWLSQEDPVSFLLQGPGLVDYHKPFRAQSNRIEMATMNTIGFAGMEASTGLLLELGPEKIKNQVAELTDFCRQGLSSLGLEVADGGDGAGNVSFRPEPDRLEPLFRQLGEAGIMVSMPDGYLRAAPHFHNTRKEIEIYLDHLKRLLKTAS